MTMTGGKLSLSVDIVFACYHYHSLLHSFSSFHHVCVIPEHHPQLNQPKVLKCCCKIYAVSVYSIHNTYLPSKNKEIFMTQLVHS